MLSIPGDVPLWEDPATSAYRKFSKERSLFYVDLSNPVLSLYRSELWRDILSVKLRKYNNTK